MITGPVSVANATARPAGRVLIAHCSTNRYTSACRRVLNTALTIRKPALANVSRFGLGLTAPKVVSFFEFSVFK